MKMCASREPSNKLPIHGHPIFGAILIVYWSTILSISSWEGSTALGTSGQDQDNLPCTVGTYQSEKEIATTGTHGRTQGNTPKIYNGTDAPKGRFPYVVALMTDFREVICTGILIHPEFVVTAAHCVTGKMGLPGDDGLVFFGDQLPENHIFQEDQLLRFTEKFIHPKYKENTILAWDIALLKLQRPAPKEPAEILEVEPDLTNGQVITLGWGSLVPGQDPTEKLQMTSSLEFPSREECEAAYDEIMEHQGCTLAPWGDACQGDSGGPIVVPDKEDNFPYLGCSQRDRILGFISKGDHCDKKNSLGAYIRLSHFRDWIEDIMEGDKDPRPKNLPPGKPAPRGRFPYIASLQDESGTHVCTGTLVAPQFVLTGAQCFDDKRGKLGMNPVAYVGAYGIGDDAKAEVQMVPVVRIFKHPQYNSNMKPGWDVAVAKLNHEVKGIDTPLLPIETIGLQQKRLLALGWGGLNSSGEMPSVLQLTPALRVVANKYCKLANIKAHHLCLQAGEDGSPCEGDSGGPVLIPDAPHGSYQAGQPKLDTLVGVTVFAFGCNEEDSNGIGVYTRVTAVKSWIQHIIQESNNSDGNEQVSFLWVGVISLIIGLAVPPMLLSLFQIRHKKIFTIFAAMSDGQQTSKHGTSKYGRRFEYDTAHLEHVGYEPSDYRWDWKLIVAKHAEILKQDRYWQWKNGYIIKPGATNNTRVVVKCAAPPEENKKDQLIKVDRALKHEAKILCKLKRHDNIVGFYGGQTINGRYCLVFEEWDMTLTDAVHTSGHIQSYDLLQVFRQIASGLRHMHKNQVVHQGLSSDSIVIKGDLVKIADFELAKVRETPRWNADCMGRISYTAPEVLMNKVLLKHVGSEPSQECTDARGWSSHQHDCGGVTFQCDVYSFGVIMWECIEKKHPPDPFKNQEMLSSTDEHDTADSSLSKFVFEHIYSHSNSGLQKVILSCLKINPKERPDSASVLLELDALIDGRN